MAQRIAIEQILDSLRWREDMVITNYEGDRVWLGIHFNNEGVRIGIVDCCLESDPCDWHRACAQSGESGRGSRAIQ